MKQNHWKKKVTSYILLAAMAVMSVSGCSSSRPEGNPTSDDQTEASGQEHETIAKGRYVESKVKLPIDEDSMIILDMIKGPNGNIQLFAQDKDYQSTIIIYEYNGNTWDQLSADYLDKIPKKTYISHFIYGADEALYLTFKDDKYKDHLAIVSDRLDFTEIPVEGIIDSMVTSLLMSLDGTAFISLLENTLMVNADGTIVHKFSQKSAWTTDCDSFTVTPTSFLAAGDQGFIRYDQKNGEEKEIIPYQSGESDVYGSLAAGEKEDFYLCNAAGIHHMMENGTIWETVVDGSLVSLGMPSVSINRLFTGADQDFYVWYAENERAGFVHYSYDAEMPSVPSKTLTIYGLDLSENMTIRQAASLYQMENPDVRVEVIDGQNDAGGVSVSDTIRALNTELVNGKGADILVLDGLPASSYIEKGILEDLQQVIGELMKSGELYDNLTKPFYEESGSVYQFPSRISFPIIVADKENLGHFTTLEELQQFQLANPEKPLLSKTRYDNILRELGNLYYPELVDTESGHMIPGKVKTLLETSKTLGDACGAKVMFDESEDGGRGAMFNFGMKNRTINSGVFNLFGGSRLISIELPSGMQNMMLPYGAIASKGYAMEQLNETYFTLGMLGVTSTGKEKDTALDFIRFILGSQVQGSDLSDGFPVNPKGAEQWLERESLMSMGVSTSGDDGQDIQLDGDWPDREKRQALLDYIPTLTTPICLDAVLMEMIINESKGYFEGTQTADQAAAAVENKAKLYEAEQQ